MLHGSGYDASVTRANEVLTPAILHWRFQPRSADWTIPKVWSKRVGAVTVSHVSGGPCLGWRDRELIAQDDPDLIGVVCTLSGRERFVGCGNESIVQPGDIAFFRSREELSFEVLDWSSKLVFLAPRSKFNIGAGHDRLPGNGYIRSDSPMGAILGALLMALADQIARADDRATECMVESALDLVAKTIAMEIDGPATTRTTLFQRIIQFIDRRLKDDLSPASIASAHGISVRYLHLLFSREGATVSAWIRERRLIQCHEELTSRNNRATLTEIAQRWHFCDSAHFSRQFKKRFGLSPKELRKTATLNGRFLSDSKMWPHLQAQ